MGRTALILIMGLGFGFGYISSQIRSAMDLLTASQEGYYKYAMARNIARVAIHRSLRYIDRNATVANYTPPTTGSFNGCSYTASTTISADTMWLNVSGTYADSTYYMRTKLLMGTKPFPTVTGAIGVRASPLDLTMTGGASVDGRNYDSTGTALDPNCPNKPGFAVMNSSDSSTVVHTSTNIYGSQKAKVDTSTQDPGAFIDEYEANADTVINAPGVYGGQRTFGTSSNPWITVINAGEDTSFSIKFTGGTSGWGVLAINGNVWFAGGIDFHGLVVVYGRNNIVDFTSTGTPKIVGGLIVAGRAASLTLKGTGSSGGKVAYSCQALNKAKNLTKLRYYAVQEWYE